MIDVVVSCAATVCLVWCIDRVWREPRGYSERQARQLKAIEANKELFERERRVLGSANDGNGNIPNNNWIRMKEIDAEIRKLNDKIAEL